MPYSMTGYGQAQTVHDGFRILWRLKSVNHRFLDLSLRLPEGSEGLELSASRILKEIFHRGHIDGSLHLHSEAGLPAPLELDESLLVSLMRLEQKIMEVGGPRPRMDAGRVLSWPGMVREVRVSGDSGDRGEGFDAVVLDLLRQAAGQLNQVRAREGGQTKVVILGLLEDLKGRMGEVAQRLPEMLVAMKGRLRERLEGWLAEAVEEHRLLQEVAILSNRVDISEEMDRLAMHCSEMAVVLAQDEPVGRRLDFLCQEFNREANTLCSKSQDGMVSQLGVEMKVIIEKLREQVQNLE